MTITNNMCDSDWSIPAKERENHRNSRGAIQKNIG